MCSYTSLSSDGDGDGDGHHGSNSGGNGVDNTYSKKVKKQKIPKRGPGVAELEKILRDQEKKDTSLDKTKNIEGFCLVSQLSSSYQRQSPILPSPKSHPKNLPFAPDPNLFSPQSTTFFGDCSKNTSLQGCRGTGNGGSDIVLHGHGFLPTMWNSCQPNADIRGPGMAPGNPFSMRSTNGPSQLFPSSSMTQRSQYSPAPMINFFPESVASSSSKTPSSAVMHQGIEPPSNQTSHHHYNSVWPDEDKASLKFMVGSKRSFPFSMEAPPIPHHYRVPAFSPHFSRQDSSLACASHNITNPEQIESVSSNKNIGSKRSTDYAVAKGHFFLFGSPTVPSPSTHISQQEQSRSKHPQPFEESTEDSQHRSAPGSGSICNKPPFSFLLPVDQKSKVGTNFSLNNDDRIEARGDGIDLDLRL
ncbi:hypothetical protein SADUNF_Sadunf04G0035100 [Salix dunnii]|uniref:Uncharacterized protein n=1 Tax=Salix dunnii TaxID=1413687 RepID=A0A835K3N9_9ROSI|nr:hypothetical protein SADUNF_Sadunf04G0035100 [Salix dunnii]